MEVADKEETADAAVETRKETVTIQAAAAAAAVDAAVITAETHISSTAVQDPHS